VAKNHLTKRQIDAARYQGAENARCVLWDDDPRGLGLRIFPSGRKAWVLSYRTAAGTKRLLTLGDHGTRTLEQARKLAKRELVQVESEAADPVAEKVARRIEATTGSIEAMFRAYVDARRKDRRRPMKGHAMTLAIGERLIFPPLGARQWRELRRSEVRQWHASLAESPYAANRALQALRAAYYWRLAWEDDAPAAVPGRRSGSDARNPCWGIPLFPERPRQVRLELDELPRLEAAIDKSTSDPYQRALFRFLLATGCRRGEALKLRWADVTLDGTRRAVTFRETKTGDDHAVPLSERAAALLAGLPRIAGNPYCFAGAGGNGHLVGIDKTWGRVRKLAALPHLRIHDLRRTFGSWLGEAGFTSKQIGSVLGHRTDITSRVYMALGDQSKRAAVDAAAVLMENAGRAPKRRGTVVSMRRSKT